MEPIAPYIIFLLLASLVYLWARDVFYLRQLIQKTKNFSQQSTQQSKEYNYVCLGYPSKRPNDVVDILFQCSFTDKVTTKTYLRRCELTDQYKYVALFLCDPQKGFVKAGEIENKEYKPTDTTER